MAAPLELGTDDYAQLHAMQMSDDPAQQAQASALAKKLTPAEQQQFFDYQKTQHPNLPGELNRPDRTVLGMPPELVAAMAGPLMKAATAAGQTVGQRLGATMKSALGQAHPLVKYQITKSALEHLGLPESIALPVAIVVSGYRTGNAPAAASSAAPEAAAAAEAASAPAADIALTAPAAGTTAPVPVAPTAAATVASTAKAGSFVNDAMRAFKAVGETPGPAELSNAASMMKFGKTAEQAVARVLEMRPAAPVDAAAALAAKLGTPADDAMLSRIVDRNATGRWK